jgi:hypothetical protein
MHGRSKDLLRLLSVGASVSSSDVKLSDPHTSRTARLGQLSDRLMTFGKIPVRLVSKFERVFHRKSASMLQIRI